MKAKAFWLPAMAGVLAGLHASSANAAVVTFEGILSGAESAWKGEGGGGLSIGGANFSNSYDAGSGYWEGFAVSNRTDTTTGNYLNDTSAYAGGGAGGSSSYGVAFIGYSSLPTITYDAAVDMAGRGMSVTNTTYAYLSMQEGDEYAKKFGGATGADADWFLLTVTGYFEGGESGTVEFYLADFREDDPSLDYIIDDWTFVDLSGLGVVDELRFSLSSSDVGRFGMNTPAYFAFDDLATVPEPSTLMAALSGVLLLARRKRNA